MSARGKESRFCGNFGKWLCAVLNDRVHIFCECNWFNSGNGDDKIVLARIWVNESRKIESAKGHNGRWFEAWSPDAQLPLLSFSRFSYHRRFSRFNDTT
jgi:hypothetical protein